MHIERMWLTPLWTPSRFSSVWIGAVAILVGHFTMTSSIASEHDSYRVSCRSDIIHNTELPVGSWVTVDLRVTPPPSTNEKLALSVTCGANTKFTTVVPLYGGRITPSFIDPCEAGQQVTVTGVFNGAHATCSWVVR